jgi:uncharacterized membrane protein HdeD (DUF308 family)
MSLRSYTMAEGILLIVLGALAIVFPYLASRWVTALVALAFLVGGILGWINALLRASRLRAVVTFWRLVLATLFLIAGGWIIARMAAGPQQAALQVAALARAIGVVFLVEGVVESVVALTHRSIPGWRWGLINGLVTLLLGVLIVTLKFWNLLWVLGTLVGISFLFSGLDLLTFSASFHPKEE